MVSDLVKAKVEKINTKEDFDRLIEGFKLSEAPLEARQEAIRYLKAQKSQFDTDVKIAPKEVMQMIKDGEADISDMGTGY